MTMQQKNKFRVIELFGGIGAMTQALKRLGIDFEIVDYVEIDKYAVASYNAMNDTNFEPQDITEWDKQVKCDLIMHGSPCQDFSIGGLQKGADAGSGTRSSLMWETVRIVNKLKPKYVVWENVKNVISETHWHNFEKYLNAMSSIGYASAWQVLNAKDYGVPQNRERVFVVSVLNGRTIYETMNLFGDSEKKLDFEFPKPFPLVRKLKDILEENVDEKYFLKPDKVSKLCLKSTESIMYDTSMIGIEHYARGYDNVAPTLCATDSQHPRLINETILSATRPHMGRKMDHKKEVNASELRIRRITPLEAWRLMGQRDEEFRKAQKVNTDMYLLKQAGNSIVVDALYYLMKAVFEQNE